MATHSNILAWRNPHGQRSLESYSPWGRKELDTTEQLRTAQVALVVQNLPADAGNTRDAALILDRRDHLEKEMATHSNILAWKIPWTEELGGLPSMGSQRIRHG